MLQTLLHLPRLQKQIMAAALDALCLPLIFILAIWLRYDGFNAELFRHYFWLICSIPFVSVPIFIRIGLYRAVIRFIDQKIITTFIILVCLPPD